MGMSAMTTLKRFSVASVMALLVATARAADSSGRPFIDNFLSGRFTWSVGPPLVWPAVRSEDPCHAIKDPSIVRYLGQWHLFCTIRSRKRTHQIEYLFVRGLDRRGQSRAPRAQDQRRLLLRAGGFLFHAAEKMVSHLSGQRPVAQTGIATRLFHNREPGGPGFMEQTHAALRAAASPCDGMD